jgi:hypothetical protein
MDGVIPVEVASFRLGERLVSGVQCGAQSPGNPGAFLLGFVGSSVGRTKRLV